MKRIIPILICCFIIQSSIAQNMNVQIVTPTLNQVSDSVLSVSANVTTFKYAIDSVIAIVNGRRVSLIYNSQTPGPYYWLGNLSLSGFSEDTLNLMVVAIDAQANRDTATVRFIYDRAPVLAIIEPLNYSVARPLLHVKVRCVNKDSCGIYVSGTVGNSTNVYGSNFIDSVNTAIDLSKGEGSAVLLNFTATDKYGQTSKLYGGYVFVESSPYLTKVFEGRDLIIDFNYNKVLTSGNGLGTQSPYHPTKIIDINTKDSVIIPTNVVLQPRHAYLTPPGAILIAPLNGTTDSVVDWNSSTLNFLGYVNGDYSLLANGGYAIWTGSLANQNGLVYRNYVTNATTLVSSSQGMDNSGGNAISLDGTAAYSALNSLDYQNIFAYKSGSTQTVTNNTTNNNISNSGIATDGRNFLYNQFNNMLDSNYLHLFDGSKDTLLASFGTISSLLGMHRLYQAANHFIAYPNPDISGYNQLWLKDSLGNYSKITNFNTVPNPRVQLDLLNNKGDVVLYAFKPQGLYSTQQRRYFDSKGQVQEICSALSNDGFGLFSQTFYRDSSWYIAIGRDLFRINVNIAANTVTNSSIIVKKDSVYGFSSGQFAADFKGPGQLISIMVTTLPANGSLFLNGVTVQLNTPIVRADLDQLSYTPNTGYTGVDSFAWNGSNGINYTVSPALVRINVSLLAPPQRPVLSGIVSSYCNNQGIQTVNISNLPASGNGTVVQAKLDFTVIPIAGNASISFNVDTMGARLHTLSVTYSNNAGTTSTADSFMVIQAVTPRVSLSVGEGSVTPASSPVTITALPVAGGGNNPTFTFASDKAFSDILQAASSMNTLTVEPSSLTAGSNWFYVLMKTSDSCYTAQTAIDSARIQLVKKTTGSQALSGLVDPDYPNQGISTYPNPFDHQLTITGLQPSKSYSISITDAQGRQIFTESAVHAQQLQINVPSTGGGVYALRLYDETKSRVIGVIKLLGK
jgi:type IX secretion system substrate protein